MPTLRSTPSVLFHHAKPRPNTLLSSPRPLRRPPPTSKRTLRPKTQLLHTQSHASPNSRQTLYNTPQPFLRSQIQSLLRPRRLPRRKFSTQPPRRKPEPYNPTPNLSSPAGTPPLSLSQRMRKLSREYGWSAVGVYFALSALDFPFCFLAVRHLGTERIGRWEHVAVEWAKRASPLKIPGVNKPAAAASPSGSTSSATGPVTAAAASVGADASQGAGDGILAQGGGVDGAVYDVHGVREAEAANAREDASIWTQLALAYAIHKSFIFIRVPLTAAVTPKVVRVLRGWGWDIGKRKGKGVVGTK